MDTMDADRPEKRNIGELEPLSKGDVTRLGRLEAKIGRAMNAAGAAAGEALAVIRDEKLYRATHKSFGQYVLDRWGLSRSTAYRMIEQASGLVLISPSESEKEQVNVSHGETNRASRDVGPETPGGEAQTGSAARSATPPGPPSEGVAPQRVGPTSEGPAPAAAPESHGSPGGRAPSDQSSEEVGPAGETRPAPLSEASSGPGPVGGTSAVGAGVPPTGPPDELDADAAGLRWLRSKTEQQIRATGDPWGPAIRAEIERHAKAYGLIPASLPRRQGTISRPEDRSAPIVFPGILLPAPARRDHDVSCSCFRCNPPKAAKG